MKAKEKQPSIEYVRLLACLLVVACHVNFFLRDDASHQGLKTLYFCLFSDGVAVFWMITGCFLFSVKDALTPLKRFVRRFALPTGCLFLLCLALSSWHFPPDAFDHTWYLSVYLAVAVTFPLVRLFAEALDRGTYRDLIFLILSFLLFLCNDLRENTLLHFGFSPVSGLLPAYIQILWGHILYRRLHEGTLWQMVRKGGKRTLPLSCLICALLFFLLNLLRAYLQLLLYDRGCLYNLRVWHTSFGLLCAACILIPGCLYSGVSEKTASSRLSVRLRQTLAQAATHTFGIYLLHPVAAALLKKIGLWKSLQDALFSLFSYGAASLLFLIAGTLLLFLISLGVCLLLSRITDRVVPLRR